MPGGTCSCYQGFSGADCSSVSYIETYNCGYKCTFDQARALAFAPASWIRARAVVPAVWRGVMPPTS
jgi:hypothetical protein